MDTEELLFAYGTLLDPNVQQECIGRTIGGTPDTLAGYQRLRVEITTDGSSAFYYTASPNHNHTLHGIVLSITSAELAKTDAYETDVFRREQHTLQSGRKAWVYSVKP